MWLAAHWTWHATPKEEKAEQEKLAKESEALVERLGKVLEDAGG